VNVAQQKYAHESGSPGKLPIIDRGEWMRTWQPGFSANADQNGIRIRLLPAVVTGVQRALVEDLEEKMRG
jgi:hypothetical protein